VCVCISLCTTVVQNTAQNSFHNSFPLNLQTIIIAHIMSTEGWLRFYVLLDAKQVISETLPMPISWLGVEKQNPTQQKHSFTNQKKCTTTQNNHNKLKPGLVASYDVQSGNRKGPILPCTIKVQKKISSGTGSPR